MAAAEHEIRDIASLERLYGVPAAPSCAKEIDYLHPHYRAFIAAAPFAVLVATSGPDGLDASPRGDPPGFVVAQDEKTLLIPDRRGNNRADSLRNIITDPRVALLFLIPGSGETLRVNGRAIISIAPTLLARFSMEENVPRSVLVVRIDSVYFQCARAILRARLWDPDQRIARGALPTPGRILADLSAARFDGVSYDRDLPERLKTTLY